MTRHGCCALPEAAVVKIPCGVRGAPLWKKARDSTKMATMLSQRPFLRPSLPSRPVWLGLTVSALLTGIVSAAVPKAPPRSGDQIYRELCASCHGAKGEGTKAYQKPLAGSRSTGELTGFIARSMPPG